MYLNFQKRSYEHNLEQREYNLLFWEEKETQNQNIMSLTTYEPAKKHQIMSLATYEPAKKHQKVFRPISRFLNIASFIRLRQHFHTKHIS